jgi:hypothetical protein
MKSFKSIREGNYAEPGVSEIDDVPEDPMSFVEIKPKKTKVVKEGIVDSAANARVRIFSSIDRKKKELYKNAVKEDVQEAVTVKKANYSFGRMMTVHHGSDTSYPLHPENQQAIAKLGDGEKTSFKDETNSTVHAEREGDTVHLTRPRLSSTKTSVAHSHFNEETEQGVAEGYETEADIDKQIEFHKQGQATAQYKGSMNKMHAKKIRDLEAKKAALKQGVAEGMDPTTDSARDARGDHRGEVKKNKDGSYVATNQSGSRKIFKSEKAAEAHAKPGKEGVAEGDKKPYPKTWHDVDPKLGKQVDKMSQAEKVKKGLAHPNTLKQQGVAEASNKTLKSYLQKVSSDSMKHKADPTKRSPEKANRSVAGFAKAQNRLEKNVNEEWTKTGKTGTHIASGEKTFEWAKVDSEGKQTGDRHYRNAAGKVMGEETISELKKSTLGSYVKKASDSATMSAYGAGGESQRLAGEPVSKRPDTYGTDRKVALKRLRGIGKAADRLTKEDTVLETKGAPKGFHFTKDGKLKRGDADQDGNGGPMLRTDPLDKQRNKVPAVSEGVDFFKVWESIKPVEIVVEEEAVDPIVLKREADILMASHIAAHKAK